MGVRNLFSKSHMLSTGLVKFYDNMVTQKGNAREPQGKCHPIKIWLERRMKLHVIESNLWPRKDSNHKIDDYMARLHDNKYCILILFSKSGLSN